MFINHTYSEIQQKYTSLENEKRLVLSNKSNLTQAEDRKYKICSIKESFWKDFEKITKLPKKEIQNAITKALIVTHFIKRYYSKFTFITIEQIAMVCECSTPEVFYVKAILITNKLIQSIANVNKKRNRYWAKIIVTILKWSSLTDLKPCGFYKINELVRILGEAKETTPQQLKDPPQNDLVEWNGS